MKKSHSKTEKKMEAHEPAAVYSVEEQIPTMNELEIPVGCVTLDQFGERFHQKLDDCYEKLSGNCQ